MEFSKIHDIVIENIKEVKEESGYRTDYVAEKIGWSPMMFSNILHGRKVLKSEYLPHIANAIGCDINRLFKGVEVDEW